MTQPAGQAAPDRHSQPTRSPGKGRARVVFPVLFVVGIVVGLISASVCVVWLFTANPNSLHSVESSLVGKQFQIGTVESTDTYLYRIDVEGMRTGPVTKCEVLRPIRTGNVMRELGPGEAPAKQYGSGVTLQPIYEFTEDLPLGDTWHVVCESSARAPVTAYSLGPKTWPPGMPIDWTRWLFISIGAIFVWGAATGIATAVVRRR